MTFDPDDLVIIVPMLGRPHTVKPLLASIDETAPGAGVLFMVTEGDHDVIREIIRHESAMLVSEPRPCGDYAAKINDGYRATVAPLIFLGACDIRFTPGWFETCIDALKPGIGVVGTRDNCNKRTVTGDHSTHSLVTRDYADEFGTIDRPGEILHEGYAHEYVDDEMVETAKFRGAYAHASEAVVEHLHPMNGKAPMDRLYSRQGVRMRHSRRHFAERRKLWT